MEFVQRAGQLYLFAVAANADVLEREGSGIEVISNVPEVDPYDAFLNPQNEGLRVVEGRGNVSPRPHHIPAKPIDVNAELRAFVQQKMVCVNVSGRAFN